jgi:hypothetical protein
MTDHRPHVELCAGSYHACRLPGTVLVFAEGIHATSGFHTFWFHDAHDGTPAELSLWHLRPTGVVLQVVTPFSVATSFQTTADIRSVTVHDSEGSHLIRVEDVPDAIKSHGE